MSTATSAPGPAGGILGAPRLPSWLVARPRLVAALDVDVPLTVVRAPAGGGKSVLLAEWARTSSAQVRGIGVDVDVDGGTARTAFWVQVVELLQDAGLVGPEHVLALGVDALRETSDARGLLRRGLTQLGPLVLVVDGADGLDARTADDLVELAATVPALRVVVAVRGGRAFDPAQARLRLDVEVLAEEALALTVAETATMLGVDPDEARTVRRATGGLPLATRVVHLERDGVGGADPAVALERLVQQATASLDPATERLVRLTAVADSLTPALAEQLTGDGDAAERLEDVAAHGLGTWSHGRDGLELRYTTVVRQVLRQSLRATDPVRYAELRRGVAAWCDTHRRPLEGLAAAVDADDLDLVSGIIARHWYDLLSLHAGQVRPVLTVIPVHRLRRYPFILFYLAIAENADRHRRRQAVTLFGLAVAAARIHPSRVPPADKVRLRMVELVALRLTGQRRPLLHAAHTVAQLVADLPLVDRGELLPILPTVHAQTGIAFLYTGHAEEAVAQFQQGLSAASGPTAGLHNLACLAGTHALMGDVRRARDLVEEARRRSWPDGWPDGYMGSMYRLAEAVLAVEELDAAGAQTHLDALAPHLETIEHWPLLTYVQATVDLVAGRPAAALERFDATLRLHRERRSSTALNGRHLDATRMLLLVATGRAHDAVNAAPGGAGDPVVALALARAQLVAGMPEKALAGLARVGGRLGAGVRARADHAVLEAAVLAELGRDADAAQVLARAAATLEVNGLCLPLLLVRARDRAALARVASEHGLEAATRLLTERELPDLVPDGLGLPLLTPREKVVLEALTRTGSASEIAAELQVSTHTVKSQLRTLYRKLGATSRESALATARRVGGLGTPGADLVGPTEPGP